MLNMNFIRDNFNKKFKNISNKCNTKILNEWIIDLYDFDTQIIKWKSDKINKIMSLQEADEDETLEFGYAVGKAGLNFEYFDLFIQMKGTNHKVDIIFKLYKLWFIEDKSPEEMESILEEYCKEYNK